MCACFYKKYSLSNFCEPISIIYERIKKIEDLTKDTIAPVKFKIEKNIVIRSTIICKGSRPRYGELSVLEATNLAEILDYAFLNNLVHGDINRKNILSSNGQIAVLDWEPSLFQIKHGCPTLMATRPWIDPEDLFLGKLSANTDLLGFWNFLENSPPIFYKTKQWSDIKKLVLCSIQPFNQLNLIRSESAE